MSETVGNRGPEGRGTSESLPVVPDPRPKEAQRVNIRVNPSRDKQAEEMLADPQAYFAKVRREAREEAELYVARRAMEVRQHKPRSRRRKAHGSLYMRFPFADGRRVEIKATTPLTEAEYGYLMKALIDMQAAFVQGPAPTPAADGGTA